MSMTHEQIQALKAAAEKAIPAMQRLLMIPNDELTDSVFESDGDVEIVNEFNLLAGPETILSLLAERDADKALIAESVVLFEALRQRIAELEIIRASAEKLVRCKGRYHSEQNYRALAALFGVSAPDLPPLDSEARTVTVKLPPVSFFDFKLSSRFASGAYVNVEAMNKELAAAGITLVVGE